MATRIDLSQDVKIGPFDRDDKKNPNSDLTSKQTQNEGKAAGGDLEGFSPNQQAPLLDPRRKQNDDDTKPIKPHWDSPLNNFDD